MSQAANRTNAGQQARQTRRITISAKTLDSEARTVEATFATETPVRRWFGTEVLECRHGSVDMSRMEGAPVLDSHNHSSIKNILGHVESARVQGVKLVGLIRFSESPEGQSAMEKVAEGAIRSVSVGYAIRDQTEVAGRNGMTDVTVTRWCPFEVSLVGVPADPNATIRSMETSMDPEDEVIENEEITGGEVRARANRPSPAARFRRQIDELRGQAVRTGLAEADVEGMLDEVRTIDEARAAVFDALAAQSRCARTAPGRVTRENRGNDETSSRVVDALAVRLGAKPTLEGSNPLAGMSLSGLMRNLMEVTGISTRSLDDRQIVERAFDGGYDVRGGLHAASDFPSLLLDAGQRALMERFGAELTPLKRLSTKRNARDFRPQSFIRPGEAPKLEKVAENGEVKRGTLKEEKEGLQIDEYARIFGLSRKALINDDLGAFSDFLGAFAQSAASTEGDLFYNLIAANAFGGAKLSDGKSFFHADHANLAAAGTALSVSSLSTARKAMQLQKNVNGTGRAGAVPAVILVGPELQTTAEQLVASLSPAQIAEVNPFSGKLRVEVETRYEGAGWWVFADPATRPALTHGYLEGAEGPQLATREGWDVAGLEFKCQLDFGCGVYDWRAAYFNPGQ